MNGWSYELVPVSEDRVIETLVRDGDRDRERALVWFTGTPGGAVPDEDLAVEADRHGLQLIMPLRPGYGESTPRPVSNVG